MPSFFAAAINPADFPVPEIRRRCVRCPSGQAGPRTRSLAGYQSKGMHFRLAVEVIPIFVPVNPARFDLPITAAEPSSPDRDFSQPSEAGTSPPVRRGIVKEGLVTRQRSDHDIMRLFMSHLRPRKGKHQLTSAFSGGG